MDDHYDPGSSPDVAVILPRGPQADERAGVPTGGTADLSHTAIGWFLRGPTDLSKLLHRESPSGSGPVVQAPATPPQRRSIE
jgi:hypothetical protein